MTEQEALCVLAAQIEQCGSAQAWAKKHGVSPSYVSDVRMGRRDMGEKMLSALGLERVVTYRVVP